MNTDKATDKTTEKATPRPWKVERLSLTDSTGRYRISDLATINVHDTALIVKAVNAHDELVEALKSAMAWIRMSDVKHDYYRGGVEAKHQAALRAAGEDVSKEKI